VFDAKEAFNLHSKAFTFFIEAATSFLGRQMWQCCSHTQRKRAKPNFPLSLLKSNTHARAWALTYTNPYGTKAVAVWVEVGAHAGKKCE
jgi:hypothetical protein